MNVYGENGDVNFSYNTRTYTYNVSCIFDTHIFRHSVEPIPCANKQHQQHFIQSDDDRYQIHIYICEHFKICVV